MLGSCACSVYPRALKGATELEPLAWDVKADNSIWTSIPEHRANPEAILMAVKHRTKPFHGIQFHPESVCSDDGCQQLIENWWSEAQQWNNLHNAQTSDHLLDEQIARSWCPKGTSTDTESTGRTPLQDAARAGSGIGSEIRTENSAYTLLEKSREVAYMVLPSNGLAVPEICTLLNIEDGDAVLLDSEPHQRADVGAHSIIGALGPETLRLDYHAGCSMVNMCQHGVTELIDLRAYGQDIFNFLKVFINARRTAGGDPEVPFWGGLVGYINYEACLETIGIESPVSTGKPDISFAFVERSIVINHQRQQIYIQSIKPDDGDWVSMISSELAACTRTPHPAPLLDLAASIYIPDICSYKSKIRECQEFTHSGDSYELCLTDRAYINTRHVSNVWPLYLRLRSLNAAPFSAYIRLGGLSLVSSSPERFMRWTRPLPTLDGHVREERSTVQFRPIKGTVKRYPDGPDKPATSLEQAKSLLSTPKERAENLMIVDLIRHDLHGVVGSGNVCVPKLMIVEEYATLFQLVTVVEGTLINRQMSLSNPPSLTASSQSSPCSSRPHTPASLSGSSKHGASSQPYPPRKSTPGRTGIDVLAASLPPGSMTGAPKRRSCALLHEIEERQPRGVYSGILGYMDVGGGGDFSVVIRSAFRWDKNTVNDKKGSEEERDTWTVGAGGAITSLSTEDGEWEEMMAKLGSTLRLFE
ncbi:MAG: hypothetical protein L6R39_004262 [Caloplaca ligustica]|nr:MAG: hypothetical protein L6R39_004262 [Caloplaca ligustica]